MIGFVVFIVGALGPLACLGQATSPPLGYFWHITDFHFDSNYSILGDSSKMCWFQGKPPRARSQLGIYGDYACDSPWILVESAVKTMQTIHDKADFIIWTGDDTAHVDNSFFSTDKVFDIVQNVTMLLRKYFPRTQVIPVLGNHDYYPKHNMQPGPNDLFTLVSKLWQPWIGSVAAAQFSKGGYYIVPHPTVDNVHIMCLNTVLYYGKNSAVVQGDPDPAGQFDWMEKRLRAAKQRGDIKFYIIAHVPPGVFERSYIPGGFQWFRPEYNQKFIELAVNYSDTIVGMFFGHHHTDSFRMFYNSTGTPVAYGLIAPAVTPWNTTLSGVGPNNPAIRLLQFNQDTSEITNYTQYYLNLQEANEQGVANWQTEYTFTQDYEITNFTLDSLNEAAQSLYTARRIFNRYYRHNSVEYDDAENCGASCQWFHYCAVTNVDYDSFEECRQSGAWRSQGKFVAQKPFLTQSA